VLANYLKLTLGIYCYRGVAAGDCRGVEGGKWNRVVTVMHIDLKDQSLFRHDTFLVGGSGEFFGVSQ